MERWIGRVAVVTGASSGIGAAIAVDLAKSGMIVVGLARRKERIDELQEKIPSAPGKLYAIACDLTKDEQIVEAFKWIELNLGRVDVLINNAGIARRTTIITPDNEEKLKEVINTNLWGLILCTKKAFEIMKRKEITDGHFININSIAGHKVLNMAGRPNTTNVYSPSKYGVTALTEVLRQEFNQDGMKTRITSISPGAVETEIFDDDVLTLLKSQNFPFLKSEDISNAVQYVLGTPPHVQVHEIIIKPVGEIF